MPSFITKDNLPTALRATETVFAFLMLVLGAASLGIYPNGIIFDAVSLGPLNGLIAMGVILLLSLGAYHFFFHHKKIPLPHAAAPLAFDAIWFLILLILGSVAASSNLVEFCDTFGKVIDQASKFGGKGAMNDLYGDTGSFDASCGLLKSSIAFDFLAMFCFIGSAFFSYLQFQRSLTKSSSNAYPSHVDTPDATPMHPQANYHEQAPANV